MTMVALSERTMTNQVPSTKTTIIWIKSSDFRSNPIHASENVDAASTRTHLYMLLTTNLSIAYGSTVGESQAVLLARKLLVNVVQRIASERLLLVPTHIPPISLSIQLLRP